MELKQFRLSKNFIYRAYYRLLSVKYIDYFFKEHETQTQLNFKGHKIIHK